METNPVLQAVDNAEKLGHYCMLVTYDDKTQNVTTTWKTAEFKNFVFVESILEMAKKAVEAMEKAAQFQQMQRVAMDQAHTHALGQQLKLGRA